MATKPSYEALEKQVAKLQRQLAELQTISDKYQSLLHSSPRDITKPKKIEGSIRTEHDLIERIMETSPAGITRVDADGRIRYANKRAEEILGIKLSETEGRTYDDPKWKITDFDGQDFPDERLPFHVVKKTGKPAYGITHAIEWPNGRRVLLSINSAPLLDKKGAFDGIVAAIEDVTEKHKTEQNYKMLFTEMLDGFALHEIISDDRGKPVDYRFLNVNPAFERITGLEKSSILEKTVSAVLPETEQSWIEKYGNVALTGEPISFENYHRELDRYFQVTAFRPAKKQFACIFVDVTERKKTEKALAESTERFQKIFNSQLDAIFILSPENPVRILESNSAATKIFGYEKEEIIGRTTDQLFLSKAAQKEFQRALSSAIREEGQLKDFNFAMRRKDGTVFPSEQTILELTDSAGKGIGWVSVVRDLTERKKMEAQIQQAQKMESIGTLAGGIAHDFNNLLFPITGLAELLLEDLPSESIEYENAKEILSAATRASQLVKQILAFSRQSERKMIPVRIQHVLEEVLQLSRATIPTDIEIVQNLQSDCGLVLADATQIHQVAMNLITNAYHAVEKKGGEISVSLCEMELESDYSAEGFLQRGRYARLTVSDTGCGIQPETMDHIFDPYFTTKEQGKGTGLGLAVVYGIVKEHGGDIKAYSVPEEGTLFNVYLPLMDRDKEEMSVEKADKSKTGTERILLVDDEEAVVKMEKQMLERLGYYVSARTSSLDALDDFKRNPEGFDVVITDMTMPNMTGTKLAAELIRIRPDIPIVLCTGFSERISQEKSEQIGIKGFLMKPIVKSALAQMVYEVLHASPPKTSGE